MIIIVLLSIFLGAMLPVLVLATATLATLRRRITRNAARFDETLERFHLIAMRLETASRGLDDNDADVARLMHVIGSLADQLTQVETKVKTATAVGSIVGPAVAAFVQGLKQQSASEARAPSIERTPETEGENHE